MRGYGSGHFERSVFVVLVCFCAVLVLAGCSRASSGRSSRQPAAPVTVAQAELENIPVQIAAIGTVESISSVGVRSQAGGVLAAVHFKEGREVRKGALLFTIDPGQYQVRLQQAEAALKRDEAQLQNALAQERRYQALIERELISREQYEDVRTQAEALQATVDSDQAEVLSARLLLSYCYIRSPVTGKAGSLNVHPGDVIKASDAAAMVTVNQLKPIYVSFAVSEQFLSEVKNYMSSGELKVLAKVPNQTKEPEQGVLDFIDNAVDISTGTIRLKAVFANVENNLWPGQFVNVTMDLYERTGAVTVPAQAVVTGQSGQYVYVLRPDMTVESRPVDTSFSHRGRAVVDKGLSAGETVVTDGQLQLTPGAKVQIVGDNPAPAASPAQAKNSGAAR